MAQAELLARVVSALEVGGISYMLTGSVVSSAQGNPRSTHVIDIVVEIDIDQAARITAAFASDQYAFDEVAARNAISRRDMFQLTDFGSGDKIDFWTLQDDEFNKNAFSRRYRESIAGVIAYISRAEDTILQKLRWAHDYEAERQYEDALAVYELQFAKLDIAYLERWAETLSLQDIWRRMKAEAQPLRG